MGQLWPSDWSDALHEIWTAADEALDVTAVADRLYAALFGCPGVKIVTGSRWSSGAIDYLRVQDGSGASPYLADDDEGVAPLPDGEVRLFDVGCWPRPGSARMRKAGAAAVLECGFLLADGTMASLALGVGERGAADGRLRTRLRQGAEIVMACSRRLRALADLEQREAGDAFLAEASLQMDASLDVEETLRRVARMAVPAVAEACVVHLGASRLVPVASAHMAAGHQGWLDGVATGDEWFAGVLARVVEGESGLVVRDGELGGGPFGEGAEGPGARVRAVSVNPLRARGRVLGTLTFLYHRPESRIAPPELLRGLAGRAALAIDTSTLYEQRRRHVQSLQRYLLPPVLPAAEGLELGAVYQVAEADLEVGGDFYDAVRGPGGRLTLFVGDVCGRGAEAAALTGLARHTLRTLLVDGMGPGRALARLNEALLAERTTRFLTVQLVSLVPEGGGFRGVVASAGHPSPLVCRWGGRVEAVEVPGLLLGVMEDAEFVERPLVLGAGDALVMYTDGLTEARSQDGGFFESSLPSAVGRAVAGGGSAEGVGRALVAEAVAFGDSGADDIAVLVARVER